MSGVAFFAMEAGSHLLRLLPLVTRVADRGIPAHVFVPSEFRAVVEASGGRHVDLFADGREMDVTTTPRPVRNVVFAGEHAESLARAARERDVGVVVYDAFAVVGAVVARLLDIPAVNVCAGHNRPPSEAREGSASRDGYAVTLSDRGARAIEALRDRRGLEDASPYSWITTFSRDLNLYPEPPSFLTEAEREPFEPIAFYGTLAPEQHDDTRPSLFAGDGRTKVYVSLGQTMWRWWPDGMEAALGVLGDALRARDDVEVVVGLGRPGALADQWTALRDADVFFTHHGLSSTHEAVWHRTPMIGHPIFVDQPRQMETCERLGISVPLTESPREAITADQVNAALDKVLEDHDAMGARLDELRAEEERVLAGRDAIVDRILALR